MAESERVLVVKHLEFIQNAITRMATNSFIIKGWAITLTTAIFAFTFSENFAANDVGWPLGFGLALLPVLLFWGLDGYYLRQERLLRMIYDTVREIRDDESVDFGFDKNRYSHQVPSWLRTCFSNTVFWFYTSLVIATITVWSILLR